MAARTLDSYRDKRDFDATPEPRGRARPGRRRGSRFVVQQHDASSMHWDLRLEHDGVLWSWAVPKGIPVDPDQSRLAIRTEDHPLEYLEFEGEIPEGSYGAGTMEIWDTGSYRLEEGSAIDEGKLHLELDGEKVHGRYVLVRTRRGRSSADNWLLRRLDPPEDPDRVPMPEQVRPMLAKLGELPDDEDAWAFEVKWDGIRAVVFVEGGRIRIVTRNGNDITSGYPELARLGRSLGSHEAVLDGEIVAFDEHGRASFQALQSRLGLTSESTIRRRAKATPVHYVAFDMVYLDGRLLHDEPYEERRRLLREVLEDGPAWKVPAHHVGAGTELLHAVVEQGLEGIVAKRLDSPYRENSRSGAWRKIKQQQRQEFVIGGWTEGEGRRAGGIGALLLGYHDRSPDAATAAGRSQQLVYAGSVGTGFSDAQLEQLLEQLEQLAVDESPFHSGGPDPDQPGKWAAIRARERGGSAPRRGRIHYARPQLVCEVEYTEFTRDGTLRHPSFKGLRQDKPAEDVVREDA